MFRVLKCVRAVLPILLHLWALCRPVKPTGRASLWARLLPSGPRNTGGRSWWRAPNVTRPPLVLRAAQRSLGLRHPRQLPGPATSPPLATAPPARPPCLHPRLGRRALMGRAGRRGGRGQPRRGASQGGSSRAPPSSQGRLRMGPSPRTRAKGAPEAGGARRAVPPRAGAVGHPSRRSSSRVLPPAPSPLRASPTLAQAFPLLPLPPLLLLLPRRRRRAPHPVPRT